MGFGFDRSSSTNSTSNWSNSFDATGSNSRQIDTTSGQNAAKQMGDALAQAEYEKQQQLLRDPMSVAASIARIRKMREYLDAYKGGYNLLDQEVIPRRRIGGENYSGTISNRSQTGGSSSSSDSGSQGWKG